MSNPGHIWPRLGLILTWKGLENKTLTGPWPRLNVPGFGAWPFLAQFPSVSSLFSGQSLEPSRGSISDLALDRRATTPQGLRCELGPNLPHSSFQYPQAYRSVNRNANTIWSIKLEDYSLPKNKIRLLGVPPYKCLCEPHSKRYQTLFGICFEPYYWQ